jgi:hypothetical protein
MRLTTIVLFCSLLITGCNTQTNEGAIDLLNKDNGDDVGAGDVHFSVVEMKKVDASFVYELQAKYKKKLVGFQVAIPQNTNQGEKGFGKGVEIRSLGKKSDDFRNALAEIYKIKVDTNKKFVNSIPAAFVDLDIFAKTLVKNANTNQDYLNQLKLFFDSPDGDEAEIFLNVRKGQHVVELAEKDEEYRSFIIKLFTQQ